jgi:hypothetical protein
MQKDQITVNELKWISPSGYEVNSVMGNPPNKAAFNDLKPGQSVIVWSLGEPGNFETIAQFKSETEQFISSLYGDIEFAKNFSKVDLEFRQKCPFPLLSGHFIRYMNTPDCDNCSGSTCQASNTYVVLQKPKANDMSQVLIPGQDHIFSVNDCRIYIKFIEGQVSSSRCGSMGVGPQPVSNFVVICTSPLKPDIKANGSDGPILLNQEDTLKLNVSVVGISSVAKPVDHWILLYASIPNQWWSFVIRDGSYEWKQGIHYCIKMPITSLKNVEIPYPPVKELMNVYYFGIDDNSDGSPDGTWWDSVVVNRQ